MKRDARAVLTAKQDEISSAPPTIGRRDTQCVGLPHREDIAKHAVRVTDESPLLTEVGDRGRLAQPCPSVAGQTHHADPGVTHRRPLASKAAGPVTVMVPPEMAMADPGSERVTKFHPGGMLTRTRPEL